MLSLDDLRAAVDMYRGSVRFPVPLATLPGLNGPDYSLRLTYDSGTVDQTVTNWNLSDPTGVAGLGWSLETDHITADYGDPLGSDQAIGDPRLTLYLQGQPYPLIKTGSAAGTATYTMQPYRFWKITYLAATETWQVVTEDGTCLTFGNADSGRGTVDWGYAWGNWMGASIKPTGRSRVAVGWSLAQTADLWGNGYTFTYTQATANLGGDATAPYTQATYLQRVDSSRGGALTLSYADKQAVEYQNPHAGTGVAAWQSRFATKVLTGVTEIAAGGAVLVTTALSYATSTGGVETIGTGDMTKRLLMNIARQVPNGYDQPDLRFTYDTNATSDSYGALLTVTAPAGGMAAFTYSRPTLTLPRRDRLVTAPVKTGVTYDTPRFFFGQDYTVVLWHGSDNSVAATAYRWEGRWLSASVAAASAPSLNAYNQLQVTLGDRCFGIVGASDYTVFHMDPNRPGAWIGSSTAEPTGLPVGEAVATTAGTGYVALLATQSGTMVFRWFNGSAWQSLNCPAATGTQLAALDGASQMLVRLSSTGSGATHDLLLVHPDSVQGWVSTSFHVQHWAPVLDGLSVRMGNTYAVLTFTGPSGPYRNTAYYALRWDSGCSNVQSSLLNQIVSSAAAGTAQVRGATVLIGQDVYRFDGATWEHQDLSTLTHTGQQQVALALGADSVTRTITLTGGSVVYDLLTYNPADTTGTPWSYATGFNGVAAKTGTATATMPARFGPGNPGAASRFVLFNNQLYLLQGDGTWTSALAINDTFTTQTIASLSLYAGDYLVYQTSSGVTAYPLRGGGLAADSGIVLNSAQVLTSAGQLLAGETAFVAYTGTWGQSGVAMTLCRAVAGDVRNALTPLVASSITLYGNGMSSTNSSGDSPSYGTVSYAYDFGATTATVSTDGRRLAANQATSVPGVTDATQGTNGSTVTYCFNDLSDSESPALPYPTGADQTNASDHVTNLSGVPYAQLIYAQGQTQPVNKTTYWWWTTVRPTGARQTGAYNRCRQTIAVMDNVPLQQNMSYSTDTGLTTQTTTARPDGQSESVTYTYWWEQYDPTRSRNMLTPVVQTLRSLGTPLFEGQVTTWQSDWGYGSGQWAPQATYVATKAGAATFNAWSGPPTTPPDGWLLTEQICARTSTGTVLLTKDALGVAGSSVIARSGHNQLASFTAADLKGQEAYYYGCEPYEDPGPWHYLGGSLDNHIVPGEANLGSRSLEITADTAAQSGPVATFLPAGQSRSYRFSCWIQTPAGFDTVSGTAQFTLSVYTVATPPQQVGTSIALPMPTTNGTWQYISTVVDLASLRSQHAIPASTQLSITILGYNQKANQQVLVDGLKFQPTDGGFYGQVLDPGTYLPCGTLQLNGNTYHAVRDANGIITAVVGPDTSVARVKMPSFARLLTADGTYQENLPNMVLSATAGSAAEYQNFEASDASQWTLPQGWSVGSGQIAFAGMATGPRGSQAALKTFTHPNYLVRVRYLPPTTGTQPNVGIGCDNVLVYHDAQANAWILTGLRDQQWTNLATQSGTLGRGDLVFFVLDGQVNFFAAGQQIFSYDLQGITADGTVNLYLTGSGAFQELIALAEPQVRLTMFDGWGMAVQTVDLSSGEQVDAGGNIYDPLGRVSYDKSPVYVPLAETGNRIAGGTTAYLPPVGGSPQTLDHYIAYGNGSTFERVAWETSPLGRPQQIGQPGDLLAIGGSHAAQLAYAQNTATGPMAGLVPNNVAGNYHLTTLTDPDGTTIYSLISPLGQTLAQRAVVAGGQTLTYGYSYDAAGRLTTVTPPNAFTGSGTPSSAWNIAYTRDFLGRPIATTSPDSGTTQVAYDSLGRQRFLLDAAGAAQTPPHILYTKYDGLGRVIETGSLQNSAVTWAVAQSKVDLQGWPGSDPSPVVAKTCTYDVGSGSMAGTNTEGRLWQVCTYKTSGSLEQRETYSYDLRGNIVTHWTEAPDYDDTTWMTTYRYDSRDRIAHIDYPRSTTATTVPFSVDYTYDRVGRVAAVAGPQVGYGSFQYNPDNSVSSASYNNGGTNTAIPVTFSYSTAGWPLSITSPVYTETVTYTTGGYGSTAYYDSQVASIHATWKANANALFPLLDYTARFAYDSSGRLTAASPYLGDDGAVSGGSWPIQYDANGNLVSVKRGDTTSAYAYPATTGGGTALLVAANDPAPPSNRLQSVTDTLSTSCDFSTTTPPQGWRWGATNNGPGGAQVVDGGPQGSKCLQISGGTAGMAGYLEYRGPIDAAGQYTLTYSIKADPAFGPEKGPTGWYAVLYGPDRVATVVQLQDLSGAPTVWTPQTVSINLQNQLTNEALFADVTEVAIRLINHKISGDCSPGAVLQIAGVQIAGSGSTGTIGYTTDGGVATIPNLGMTQMQYAADYPVLISAQTARDGGAAIAVQLDAYGNQVLMTATPTGGTAAKSLNLWGPPGMLLARIDSDSTGTHPRYCVCGPQGVFAVQDDGHMSYVIRGQDGTVKAAVDETCQICYLLDTDAFGQPRHEVGTNPVPAEAQAELTPTSGDSVPGLGRSLVPKLADGYTDQLIEGKHQVYSAAWYNAIQSVYQDYDKRDDLLKDIRNILTDVKDGKTKDRHWFEHTLSANKWQGMDFETVQVIAWQRFFTYWRANSQCVRMGMQAISVDAMAEDMFHGVLYEDQTGVDARDLDTDPPEPGFYIFAVSPEGKFLYRTMCDRAKGEELYVRHSQLNGGKCAPTAGQMWVKDKKEVSISNGSGHYLPSGTTVGKYAVSQLQAKGYQVGQVWTEWWQERQNIKHMMNQDRAKWCPKFPERPVH